MASSTERAPYERETLIFPTPEAAQVFKENVGEKIQRAAGQRSNPKQAVAQALADEFTKTGEAVNTIREPWEHTRLEHEEAQRLVDLAFVQDLKAALKTARASQYYPRNIDLFHDVLTGEMYDLMREHKLNKQPLLVTLLLASMFILIAALGMLFLFLFII